MNAYEIHPFARILHVAKTIDRMATGTAGAYYSPASTEGRLSFESIVNRLEQGAREGLFDQETVNAAGQVSRRRLQRVYKTSPPGRRSGEKPLLLRKEEETRYKEVKSPAEQKMA